MPAGVHHTGNGALVTEIYVGDAGASGCVVCRTVIAWHDHIAVKVALRLFLFLFSDALLTSPMRHPKRRGTSKAAAKVPEYLGTSQNFVNLRYEKVS